jgi:hypothetical protein
MRKTNQVLFAALLLSIGCGGEIKSTDSNSASTQDAITGVCRARPANLPAGLAGWMPGWTDDQLCAAAKANADYLCRYATGVGCCWVAPTCSCANFGARFCTVDYQLHP